MRHVFDRLELKKKVPRQHPDGWYVDFPS